MGKANISFPEGMLEEIDRRAEAAGLTRSGLPGAVHRVTEPPSSRPPLRETGAD